MSESEVPKVRLDAFRGTGLTRGRSRVTEALWILCRSAFFLSSLPWPSSIKASILRAFGASVGKGLYIRPRVYIHFPWKLSLGQHCWIGERCEILNLEPISMGAHSALAHDVYLAAGGHDIESPTMEYRNAPIVIGPGVWIASRAFIGPGVTLGANVVVKAGAIVVNDAPSDAILAGVPARVVGKRSVRGRA